jgi:hypothetical protein
MVGQAQSGVNGWACGQLMGDATEPEAFDYSMT